MNRFITTLMSCCIVISLHAKTEYFSTPKDAVDTFINAIKIDNKAKIESLFTKGYVQFIDANTIEQEKKEFLDAYDTSHHLMSFDGRTVYIAVGKSDWTFPVPLAKAKKGWFFDSKIGLENMKTRYIGKNELDVIATLEQYHTLEELAQSEIASVYAFSQDKEGNIIATPKAYDQSAIMSFALTKDGGIYEADTEGRDSQFDNRFKKVPSEFLH